MTTTTEKLAQIAAFLEGEAPLSDEQTKTHAALWRLAVRKGIVTVHSERIVSRDPGTRASWIEGHAKSTDISNEAARIGVKLDKEA